MGGWEEEERKAAWDIVARDFSSAPNINVKLAARFIFFHRRLNDVAAAGGGGFFADGESEFKVKDASAI